MIKFQLLTKENMAENALDNYDRLQNVRRVYRKIDSEYMLVEDVGIMDWSFERKQAVAKALISDDYITFGAIREDEIVGFASIEKQLQGKYIVLDMMQVSRKYRGKGMGRTLFQLVKEKAKEMGAKQLYISACASEETIEFYKSMGCKITDNPIKKIAEDEPFDLQMVCDVD
ncbi:GNAT family N-acetyltransferase [Clostridium cellulovorans]|uniref:GCN5-related N-acetyltransferase n=1 Tax=Clostridium cellulovorans (strain ATCC 35296 / DSM 3052 / OCM 3 / 743B) TaxID=573061 RepID=D9SNS3_CLOC7|nr:GNAT family N-acetyltransferase [Clostridium cellulovorans]ADL49944.1 GCN5-related N-acetyltransferase [Clostridium cellulovorans 743B]